MTIEPIQTTDREIVERARTLSTAGKKWHFHILTPTCTLNTGNDFVLMLENTADELTYEAHSVKKPSEAGKQLVELLHGKDVTKPETTAASYVASQEIATIASRAKDLNGKGIAWHHHAFSPKCRFNDSGRWMIMFEDPETGKKIRSVTAAEPKDDLKQIEELFYAT